MSYAAWLGMILTALAATTAATGAAERQLTFDDGSEHRLDSNHNFSPDGQWLAFDTRTGPLVSSLTIEKVHVETGQRVVLYRAPEPTETGPAIGAVSYLPGRDEVVFIHGPFTATGLPYEFTRRTGAIVPGDGTGSLSWPDARDVTAPFTPGALRGGTHRHDPGGPDGRWIGFTYNDRIMKLYGQRIGSDLDLRTLGVTHLGIPVAVDEDTAGENRSGRGFSVVIVNVVRRGSLDSNPGTDAIYRATDDQWIGTRGYRKPDGTWQLARAFIGKMRVEAPGGVRDHSEVFVVDIPDDIALPGPNGPLEGTDTTAPAPPAGASQRRLTHTERGCFGLVRSTSDGSTLSFMSVGENRKPQLFTISPLGGEMTQVTDFPGGARAPARWLPDDRHFVTVTDKQVVVVDAHTGKWRTLTSPADDAPSALVLSPNGRLVAFNRSVESDGKKTLQIFVTDVVLPQ